MLIFIISVQSVKNCETKITHTSQYCVSEHKEDFCPHVCELGYNTVIVTPSFQTKKNHNDRKMCLQILCNVLWLKTWLSHDVKTRNLKQETNSTSAFIHWSQLKYR